MHDREQPRTRDGGAPPAAPPHTVRAPVNIHHWDDISFLHWRFEPRDIARRLPDRLALLTFDGAAWVGVTPFWIRVRPPGVPIVPPRWAFPETNVRTYVTGPDGREGVWFLRMEVTALWFVAVLRSIGLPYVWQRMSVDVGDAGISYRSRPRGPWSGGGGRVIVVRPGEALDPPEGGPAERFLTARWGAYHTRGPVLLYTPVEHPRWPLRTATVGACEVGALFRAAGLPAPVGPPVTHFSPGVTVGVGLPRIVT